MEFVVLTDTHGETELIKKVLEKHKTIKNIIFLGDVLSDLNFLNFSSYNIVCVKGNCDFFVNEQTEKVLKFKKVTLLVTHGHNFSVKSGTQKLKEYAVNNGINVVLFGHTHKQYYRVEDGITLINVGSLKTEKSYGILNITDSHTKIDFLTLNGEEYK